MNQILITGDEQRTGKVIENVKKQKKLLPVNGVVIFFSIILIILGICLIIGSIYAKQKINETVQANIKPEITVERNDENNTIQITVTHIRGIQTLTYRWNNEKETTINGENRKLINETIDLIGGENTLKISVTEENGQIKTFEKTFIAGNIPEIQLEAIANGIKVIATSEENIEYVQYGWDDDEMQKVDVGEKQYEGIINAPQGEHLLKIEVVDINGLTTKKEQVIIGDTAPTLKIESKLLNGNITFIINAEDDEGIKTIELIHNGGEKQTIEVNAKTYHEEIIMTEGEENTLIVRATNINNLQQVKGAKFDNR